MQPWIPLACGLLVFQLACTPIREPGKPPVPMGEEPQAGAVAGEGGRGMGVEPECLGRALHDEYCAGDEVRVCGAPAQQSSRSCPAERRCQPAKDGHSVECVCANGLIPSGETCSPPTDCAAANGGCDRLTECSPGPTGPSCGPCPSGYEGSGKAGCIPLLQALTVTGGTLNRAFSPDVHRYDVSVSALATELTLFASGPDRSHLELNGVRVDSGQPWSATLVPPDDMTIVIAVVSNAGFSGRYELSVSRQEREDLYIKADHPDADDEFGIGVALHRGTLVIGALKEDSAAKSHGDAADDSVTDSGAVYVYTERDGKLEREAYLKAETAVRNDNFGASVAIWEDTIAVGVPRGNALGTTITGASGAVDVFVRGAGGWELQTRIASPAAEDDDLFGWSVALHEDRLVVGAPFDRAAGDKCGALYVYERKDGVWGRPSKLTTMAPQPNDLLGWAVAVDGDTVIGGAIERDPMSTDTGAAGSAHVFVQGPGGFGAPQRLQAPTPADGSSFGWAVAVRGETAAVGAPRADLVNSTPAGEVFVFERSAEDRFEFASRLQADIPRRSDYFGSAVALDGEALAVGASGDASGSSDPTQTDVTGAGAAYLFVRVDHTWLRAGYFKALAADTRDYLGDHVALSEGTVVATSIEESSRSAGIGGDPTNNDLDGSGAAYVFR
jgi:hypothetical protein